MKLKCKNFFVESRKYYRVLRELLFDTNYKWSGNEMQGVGDLKNQIASPIKFAFIVIGIAIGFFVIWGSFARLDSAAIAHGFVVLNDNTKTIQHFEGGVIDEILVREGDRVEEGEKLIRLNETAAKARLKMVLSQLRMAKAMEARLLAEQSNKKAVEYSDAVLDANSEEVCQIIKMQNALFETREKLVNGKLAIFAQKQAQYKEQIKWLEKTARALEEHAILTEEQVSNMKTLFDQEYASKTEWFEVKKRLLEMQGRLGEINGNIASVNELITETQLQMLDLKNDNQNEINDQLQKVQSQISDLEEQYQTAEDILERTIIRAPKAGIVTGLQFHTIGGVISPGVKIMNIVPQNDELILEAHVMPKDMESIRVGLKTNVQLSAYKSRLVPRVQGEVIYFSADRINDEKSGQAYYIARIRIKQESLDEINYEVRLYPGMPVDVFIVKGERTFLQYLISPITDSIHRAFKEK